MRIESLTFPRFVAALIVVVYHFGPFPNVLNHTPWLRVLNAGPTMVTFFFTLSGFILVVAYFNMPEGRVRARRFFVARMARIFPVYYLGLTFTVALIYLLDRPGADPDAILVNILLLQAFLPDYVMTLNVPDWAISVEAAFYLLFPVLFYKLSKLPTARALTVAVAVWGGTQVAAVLAHHWYYSRYLVGRSGGPVPFFDNMLGYNPLIHLNGFVFGLAVGLWYMRRLKDIHTMPWQGAVLVGGSVVAIVAAIACEPWVTSLLGFNRSFSLGLIVPLFALLIVALAMDRSSLSAVLSWRPLVVLGEASYAVYILHFPAYGLVANLLRGWGGPQSQGLQFAVYLITLIVLAVLTLKFIEEPARKAIRARFMS